MIPQQRGANVPQRTTRQILPHARLLPAPTQSRSIAEDESDQPFPHSELVSKKKSTKEPPPYGHRKGWVPRSLEDFGSGGAFPEIHVAQYPLNMGRKKATGNALAMQVDAEGRVKYDSIIKQGQSKDKVVFSEFRDLIPLHLKQEDPSLSMPDEEEIEETTQKTREALEKIIQTKVSAAMPARPAEKQAPAQYIRYTPAQQGPAYNSGAKQRVIRMVEMQKDPLDPPKFKTNKKIPRGPPSPPAPVMHSPPRKVTVKEQQEWKIPPCISNWKNPKGYTIPLDKRLAADGRGAQEVKINENFSKLADALYIADRKARESVELRAQMEKKLAQKEKERKEESLRLLAQKAREERIGLRTQDSDFSEDARERDQLRHDRHKERERDRRIARAAPDKRSKLERQRDRDISEKIALGMPANVKSDEGMYDQRLFNQAEGVGSGFAEDDAYNVYDKPWKKTSASSIYRPSKNLDKDIYGDDLDSLVKTKRFAADTEFQGTDHNLQRDGPVQFEKDEDDPFGLDKFLTEAKQSKRPTEDSKDSRSKKSKN
ncbi:uncharacterized protein TRIADDRAFT_51016 [Trichoplax adhaerens]|uniref:SKI-interacting protein SKIP SNW domain-containing protein n=1 Tax=Trichoplax adhaerens TaxID=10228 RepID=B3SAC1_TRIAD|nr:hypothetical protein TRIADDRAFT_51016 [Trichoplax adhaerens]EDV20286.1 hypothetical protein TRIADDRAFT_51016 [Trichoplax adhaerens]|eukprot:XP_002117236.1 hypothetical protein TRIADDRAFT_51016 [Trichoplax adhaerens]